MPFETPNVASTSKIKAKPMKSKAFDVDDLVLDDDNSNHDTHYGVASVQNMKRGTRTDQMRMD